MDLGRLKRRARLAWWQITGGTKAPEIDAGDIAQIHPDALAARKAHEERLGNARAASLAHSSSVPVEMTEGGEIVLLDEEPAPEVDVHDVRSLRAAPDGTEVDVHGETWTKVGTQWIAAGSPDAPSQSSVRLVLRAATPPAEVSEVAGIVPKVDADPLLADPLMERLERVESLGVLPEPRPTDTPWTEPDGTRSSG